MKNIALLWAILALFVYASSTATPTTLAGGEIITKSKLIAIMNKSSFVYDTRSAYNYGKGHIDGAKSLPYNIKSKNISSYTPSKEEIEFVSSHITKDKDALIVFYSHGDTGWKSYKAAYSAIKAGYTHVKWFRDGYSVWLSK
jgi:rhodanese-related sulfurtransferase